LGDLFQNVEAISDGNQKDGERPSALHIMLFTLKAFERACHSLVSHGKKGEKGKGRGRRKGKRRNFK
jgi:hypothetical protein